MIRLKKPLIYVTRDIERALGMEPIGNYSVISNDTPYGREIRQKYPDNVRLIQDARGIIDTHDLLVLPMVEDIISKQKADIVVFQNTPRIERIAAEKGWNLLNPPAELARRVEEKISQVAWLGPAAELLPPHKITTVKEVRFDGKRFVLQFNHSHTGQGTFVIESAREFETLREKFPDRECRITDFIEGPVYTVNAVVGRLRTVVGSPSYQITGLAPFTDVPFSTIGNDWSLPSRAERKEIARIARVIGKHLRHDGWRGLFGIDTVKDAVSGKMYLLEINARQPASAVFESVLQKRNTIFEAHVSALLCRWTPLFTTRIASGAQIVKRVTEKTHSVDTSALRAKGLTVMEYENQASNKELFRIQSTAGIMEGHGKLNDLGRFISSCIR